MSTLVMKTKNYFSDWTLFEISWLIISTLTMLTLSIIWGDSPMALISGVTGIISVVLCAKPMHLPVLTLDFMRLLLIKIDYLVKSC